MAMHESYPRSHSKSHDIYASPMARAAFRALSETDPEEAFRKLTDEAERVVSQREGYELHPSIDPTPNPEARIWAPVVGSLIKTDLIKK